MRNILSDLVPVTLKAIKSLWRNGVVGLNAVHSESGLSAGAALCAILPAMSQQRDLLRQMLIGYRFHRVGQLPEKDPSR